MIVVTGGTGHIGQWVIAALTERGHEVACLARQPADRPSITGLTWVGPVQTIVCDLADQASVRAAQPALAEAEVVVHLAAYLPADTGANRAEDADTTLRANVHGTIALLDMLADATRLQGIVYASTFEVYGTPCTTPIAEDHPTQPLNYYGATKLCGEKYVALAATARHLPCASLRLPAVYGPGDRLSRAIGNFISAAAAGEPIEIHGDGADMRELVYVADAAEAIVLAVEGRVAGVFNVASGRGHSIREMAESALRVASSGAAIIQRERVKPRLDYVLDVGRARTELGWAPRTPLDEGLRAQLEWLRSRGFDTT